MVPWQSHSLSLKGKEVSGPTKTKVAEKRTSITTSHDNDLSCHVWHIFWSPKGSSWYKLLQKFPNTF